MRPRIALAVVLAVAGVMPTAALADKPSYGCAPGFNLGAQTFEEYLQLPRTQGAIEAGLIDEAGVLAGLEQLDRNGNEVVCVQLVEGQWGSRSFAEFFYNVVDDNASVP